MALLPITVAGPHRPLTGFSIKPRRAPIQIFKYQLHPNISEQGGQSSNIDQRFKYLVAEYGILNLFAKLPIRFE